MGCIVSQEIANAHSIINFTDFVWNAVVFIRLLCVHKFYCFIFDTEVRQEAVQQALAALKNRPKPSLPMPSKRSSVLNRSPDRNRDDTGTSFSDIFFFICTSADWDSLLIDNWKKKHIYAYELWTNNRCRSIASKSKLLVLNFLRLLWNSSENGYFSAIRNRNMCTKTLYVPTHRRPTLGFVFDF